MHDHTVVRVFQSSGDQTVVQVEQDEQTIILERGTQGPQGAAGNDGVGITVQTFNAPGTLTVYAGKGRWYAPIDLEIESIKVSCGTAPTGQSIVVDINRNGASIFTNQANRPHIFAGANTSSAVTPDATLLDEDEYLTVDIDQVGSTFAGSDLVVVIQMKER